MVGWLLSFPNLGHFPNQWLRRLPLPPQYCGGCISTSSGGARLSQPAAGKLRQSLLVVSGSMLAESACPRRRDGSGSGGPHGQAGQGSAPDRPDTSERGGAGDRGPSSAAQQCLHTHLARARTQITLIHFKPTLSPAALQQILLKPCLHNRQSRPPAALE